jgi:hypothetical protein
MSVYHSCVLHPEALQILQQTEAELQKLIQKALTEGRYADVAAIARLADHIAQLASQDESADYDDMSDGSSPEDGDESPRPGTKLSKRAIRRAFPRFEREGDRLVKIAWSKRGREEYEHKAPREIVDLLIDYIKGRKGVGARFVAPDIFPMKDPKTKREIPSYQAYLALAWLCHEGVVVKHGRNGYSLKPTAAISEHVTQLWEALPARD